MQQQPQCCHGVGYLLPQKQRVAANQIGGNSNTLQLLLNLLPHALPPHQHCYIGSGGLLVLQQL